MNEGMIILLAMELLKYINISLIASTTIIRLAIKDDIKSEKTLDLNQYRYVLKHGLFDRLNNLKISNVDEIISNLESIVIKNQSIITIE